MLQHYSDTRTEEGRVRFLLDGQEVVLVTEGHGWQQHEHFGTFHDAALALALNSRITQRLYVQALDDLYQQMNFFAQRGAA